VSAQQPNGLAQGDQFTGVVLVGGRSTRLGIDKVELFADGVEQVLRDAGAGEVLRVGRGDLPDDVVDVGPLGGIATALRRAANDVVVVLACDLPDARPDGVRILVRALHSDADADVAMPPGEPLHAAWRRRSLSAVVAAIDDGTLAVRAALDRLRVAEVAGIDPRWLRNVNTPADLVQTAHVADAGVPEIDLDELVRRHAEGAVIYDVRRPEEYEAGHVPGAVLLPLDELGDRWEEVPDGVEVLVICATGARSGRAVQALNQAGRTTVNVAGGTKGWIAAGHPVATGTEPQ
jgi:molybdopterin-guanine dinucleotide biosynthesis protein A/rhodanese-related sulfurtransferase